MPDASSRFSMDGKINIDNLIAHSMPQEGINKGFDLKKSGESTRCGAELTNPPAQPGRRQAPRADRRITGVRGRGRRYGET